MKFISCLVVCITVQSNAHWIHESQRSHSLQKLPKYEVDVRTAVQNQGKLTASIGSLAKNKGVPAISQETYDLLRAESHIFEMQNRTSCSIPKPQIICVKDHYPDAEIKYQPACTILHRCDSTTGCCEDAGKTCQPLQSSLVTLYFMVKSTDKAAEILKLDFTNHTSCHCDIAETHEHSAEGRAHDNHLGDNSKEKELKKILEEAAGSDPLDYDEENEEESTENSCPRCPAPFSKRLVQGSCHCDCFQDDHECSLIKTGKEPLKEVDRRCVQRQTCNAPTCSRGRHFNLEFGDCRRAVYEDAVMGKTTQQRRSTALRRHGKRKTRD